MRYITIILAFFLAPIAAVIASVALTAPRPAVAATTAAEQQSVQFVPVEYSTVGALTLYVDVIDNQLHFIDEFGRDHIVVLERVLHDTETP